MSTPTCSGTRSKRWPCRPCHTRPCPPSRSRISQETLEAYEMHVAGLARDLNRPDMPAFCSSATTQLARGQHLLPGTAGAAGGRPGPAASTATQTALVLRPVPVARTPQLQVAPAGPRAAQSDAPGAAQPDAQVPARDPATESKQSRLRTQQQLHVSQTACSMSLNRRCFSAHAERRHAERPVPVNLSSHPGSLAAGGFDRRACWAGCAAQGQHACRGRQAAGAGGAAGGGRGGD